MNERQSPFVMPRTLDELMLIGLAIAWPLIVFFVYHPENLNPVGAAFFWVIAFGIECGIIVALHNARRHAHR